MTGHRLLPLVNSLIGAIVWAALGLALVPRLGPEGMAIAVGLATLAIAYAATIELRISDGLTPFDHKLFQGLAAGLAGLGLMYAATRFLGGPARFSVLLILWGAASWSALRVGLTRSDRAALGGFSRVLRLA